MSKEAPTEFALMAKSSSSSDNEVYNDSFCSKSCRKNTENLNSKISKLNEELSDCESDLSVKDKSGMGFDEYIDVAPPPAQVYSPPVKDFSWTGLPEFADNSVTDYTRPTPGVDESNGVVREQKGNNSSVP
ncbi:hypothetical protein Tco_0695704 [Tanacetum coccineum]